MRSRRLLTCSSVVALGRRWCSSGYVPQPVTYYREFEKEESDVFDDVLERAELQLGRPSKHGKLPLETTSAPGSGDIFAEAKEGVDVATLDAAPEASLEPSVRTGVPIEKRTVGDATQPSTSPTQTTYFQCSACNKTFRLLDAAQHHITTRHKGAAEVREVDTMIRDGPAASGSGGSTGNVLDPTGAVAGMAAASQAPTFPPPPKRRPLPSDHLRSESLESIMLELESLVPRLSQAPLGSEIGTPDRDPTDLEMDSGARKAQQLSFKASIELDSMTPDGSDGAVHSACCNEVTILGLVVGVERGYTDNNSCVQLTVETKHEDDSVPETHFVRRLGLSEAEVVKLMAIPLGSYVLVKGSLKSEVLVDGSEASPSVLQHTLPYISVKQEGIVTLQALGIANEARFSA